MAPRVPDLPIPITRKHSFQEADIAMRTEGHDFVAVAIPKKSLQKEEKQIAVDPQSLKDHFHLRRPTSSLGATTFPPPPPLQPPKSKFLSISQPNSATSSPRFAPFVSKKKPKGDPQSPESSSPWQAVQGIYLEKSKSCGEGRASAPSEEFEDLWFAKPKTEGTRDGSPKSTHSHDKHMEAPENNNKGFKCCLYLPGFGKAKPVRANKKEELNSNNINIDGVSVFSRTVSLEKFECGSWAPSPRAIIQAGLEANDESVSSYFDLPSELIKCGAGGSDDDAHSPVTAAFVFDKEIKGVLKNGTSRGGGGRKSDASPRHVRFSTSSSPASPASSCITPRLRRAREEFNAFLEAQNAR